jgi:hypothetical protein
MVSSRGLGDVYKRQASMLAILVVKRQLLTVLMFQKYFTVLVMKKR